jgi:ribokinase
MEVKMKILNFGSLNIDHVYKVDHFVRPGETMNSLDYKQYCGGKGLNQSIALSYAGAEVYHAGKVGSDGSSLLHMLEESGVDTRYVRKSDGVSGHAIIQVDSNGENCIMLHGGANQDISLKDVEEVLSFFLQGDYLLLQNEINNISNIMKIAKRRGLKIVLNPAPMNEPVLSYPLELVDIFILNEVEGREFTGERDSGKIISDMRRKYPEAAIVLTLGAKGVKYSDKESSYSVPADTTVKVVDTTAAGDTFIGYFLSCLSQKIPVEKALQVSCRASAICVSRPGASKSIPRREEVKFK